MKPAALPDPPANSLIARLEARASEQHASMPAERLWEPALRAPLRDFLRRPGKASRARLVELAYCVAGGQPGHHPSELPLLIESLHAGSLIIDDIEDDSDIRRGAPTLHRMHGIAIALNTGNWLYFHAQELLCQMPLPSDAAKLAAFEHMSHCLLRCHEGQALDLSARASELGQHEICAVAATVARLKTGALLGLGMRLGALAAAAPARVQQALAEFGSAIGIVIQMLDDLSGVVVARRRAKAIEDLRQGRPTWLWAWLAQDASPELYAACQARLRDVMAGGDPAELLEALRFRVVAPGRLCARQALGLATRSLRAELGDAPFLPALEQLLAQLESRYLDGER